MNSVRQKRLPSSGRGPKQEIDSPTQNEVEAAIGALIDAIVPKKPPEQPRKRRSKKPVSRPE